MEVAVPFVGVAMVEKDWLFAPSAARTSVSSARIETETNVMDMEGSR